MANNYFEIYVGERKSGIDWSGGLSWLIGTVGLGIVSQYYPALGGFLGPFVGTGFFLIPGWENEKNPQRPHCNPRLNLWNDAESAQETPPVHYDPLVLDLNRDGKINLDNATFFDLNASGFHEYTRWISETDAFLVLDINGNGKIDNGSEMFGDSNGTKHEIYTPSLFLSAA